MKILYADNKHIPVFTDGKTDYRFIDIDKAQFSGMGGNINSMGKKLADAGELATIQSFTSAVSVPKDTGQKLFEQHIDAFISWLPTFEQTPKAVKKIIKDLNLFFKMFDIDTTKLEYAKLVAEDLDQFNNDYAQIREKQETVKSQQVLDEEKETHAQALFQLEYDRATKTEQENHKEHLETKAKEQRVIQLEKVAEDDLAQNTLSDSLTRLESEVEVAAVTLTHDQTIENLTLQIELHTLQDKRHQTHKEEFLAYQQQVHPLFLHRAQQVLAYDELEINNRLNLKLAFQV